MAGHVQPADRTDAQQGHTVLLQGLRSGNKRYCSTASERSSLHFVDDHRIMLPLWTPQSKLLEGERYSEKSLETG